MKSDSDSFFSLAALLSLVVRDSDRVKGGSYTSKRTFFILFASICNSSICVYHHLSTIYHLCVYHLSTHHSSVCLSSIHSSIIYSSTYHLPTHPSIYPSLPLSIYAEDWHRPQDMCPGQRMICRIQLSPPAMWVPKSNIRLLGLVTGISICGAVCLSHSFYFPWREAA